MFATIKIMDRGKVWLFDWEDGERTGLNEVIKDLCSRIAEPEGRLIVVVEVMELRPNRESHANIPDELRYDTDAKIIDTLTFVYEEKSDSLELFASHLVHKAIQNETSL